LTNYFRLIRDRWVEPKHGQHAAGFSFFGAIGVVATQITGSARAGVVDVLDAYRPTLPDDFGGEIDLVTGWANTGAELHDHLRGIGSEAFNHLSDRVCHDAKLGTFASGMHKASRRRFWIYDVNCATVSDVNAERDAALIGDNAIAPGEFATINSAKDSGRYSAFDNADFVSVDLFGGEQRPTAKAGCVANFLMCGVEPLQYFGFIV
jgi:hypothetical protein